MGVVMSIFSCSACGGHAFNLTADLKHAHCLDCKADLGNWQTLRAKLQQNLHSSQPTLYVEVEPRPTVVSFRPRAAQPSACFAA